MLGVLIGLALVFTLEWAAPVESRRIHRAFGTLLQIIFTSGMAIFAYALGHAYQALGFNPIFPSVERWAGVWAIPVVLLATDFLRYLEHRFEHRFWWRVHAVHHSFNHLHAANSYGHPLQGLPTFVLVSLPLMLFNFSDFATPAAVALILTAHTFYIHSATRLHLGPLRHLIVDNRFHRIHHSLETQHFDRNFGVLFTVWDRLFGTAHFPRRDEWPDVGVEGIVAPTSVTEFLMSPIRPQTVEAEHAIMTQRAVN